MKYHIKASVTIMAFGRGKSNHTLARCIFLPTLFYKKHRNIMFWWKTWQTPLVKNTHTLVKENTPCYHKIRQKCGFAQKIAFFLYIIVFSSPAVVRRLVVRLDSCFLTHIKKYMTPIHALIFEKHVKMCVYIGHIKKPV